MVVKFNIISYSKKLKEIRRVEIDRLLGRGNGARDKECVTGSGVVACRAVGVDFCCFFTLL